MDRSKRILVLVKDGDILVKDHDIYIYEGDIGENDTKPTLVGKAIMYNYKDENKKIYKKLLSELKTSSKKVLKTSHENVFIITQQYLDEINKEQEINKNYRKNTYEGFFLDNERHDRGVLTTYDEDGIQLTKYEGNWKKDERNGLGVLTTYDERGNPVTIYEGEWLNDKRNGHGLLTTYDDGGRPVKKYEGNWVDNVSLKGRITFYFDDQECVYHDAEFDNEDPDKILKAKVFIRYFEKIIDDDEDEDKIIDRAIMYGTIVYDAAQHQYNAKLVIVGAYPSDIFNSEELRVEVEEEEEEQSQNPKRNKLTQDPDPELLGIPELAELLSKQHKNRVKYTYNGPIALDNNGKLKTIDENRWKPPIQPFVLLIPDSQSSQESQSSVGTSQESQEGAGGKKTRKRKYQKRKQTRKISRRPRKRSKKISTKKTT